MKYIQTQAMIIDPSNYSVAVACLPGGFATIPPKKVFGSVLIINQFATVEIEGQCVATLRNSYVGPKLFDRIYSYQESLTTDKFIDVEHIGN